jgi:hypothetical protein
MYDTQFTERGAETKKHTNKLHMHTTHTHTHTFWISSGKSSFSSSGFSSFVPIHQASENTICQQIISIQIIFSGKYRLVPSTV